MGEWLNTMEHIN